MTLNAYPWVWLALSLYLSTLPAVQDGMIIEGEIDDESGHHAWIDHERLLEVGKEG